jgi:ferric-dicitrate binding protein FerR (iron transport regulator)
MDKTELLIIKYLSKSTSLQEQAELLEWLEANEENRAHFRSLKDTYDLGQMKPDREGSQVHNQWIKFAGTATSKETKKPAHTLQVYSFMRYAAIFITGALLSYFTYSLPDGTEEETLLATTKIETGIGERSKVTLPDGSTVWINACSSVSFDNSFGNKTRSIVLEGEAYFEVQTDSIKPFLVHTDKFTHRATGTSFNVYSFGSENEMSIALLEGKVSVEYDINKEQLSPGEMITYNKSTGRLIRSHVDVCHISSWRYGEYTFDDLTFEELSKRLERMYNIRFIFDNKRISRMRFGGTLRNSYSLETIMKVIKTSVPVKYTIHENTIHIY